jgi:hypothetical protein
MVCVCEKSTLALDPTHGTRLLQSRQLTADDGPASTIPHVGGTRGLALWQQHGCASAGARPHMCVLKAATKLLCGAAHVVWGGYCCRCCCWWAVCDVQCGCFLGGALLYHYRTRGVCRGVQGFGRVCVVPATDVCACRGCATLVTRVRVGDRYAAEVLSVVCGSAAVPACKHDAGSLGQPLATCGTWGECMHACASAYLCMCLPARCLHSAVACVKEEEQARLLTHGCPPPPFT